MQQVRIGIDEAGYGPLLGPLVLGFTMIEGSLADALALGGPTLPRIADSKQLYRGGQGLARLETTALAAAACAAGSLPATLASWLPAEPEALGDHPWYAESLAAPLPRWATPQEIAEAHRALAAALDAADVKLHAAWPRPVLEGEFNARIEQLASKGRLELEVISELLAGAHAGDRECTVHCDRLGGRKFYADFLQAHHPFSHVDVLEEDRGASRYSVSEGSLRHHYEFLVKGDDRIPEIALASCLAKYGRELLMDGFNRFWTGRRPDVRPTAGYPEDARRFLADMKGDALFDATVARLVRNR